MQLAIDTKDRPSAQRIIQWVNKGGELSAYISENAYFRAECLETLYSLIRQSYDQSIPKGSSALIPYKGRFHWCEFTEEFAKTGKGERVLPESGEPEEK